MKKSGALACTVFLVFFCLSGVLAQIHEPPLPGNLKIQPPGPEVPPQLAQLVGVWEGMWDYAPAGDPGGGLFLGQMDITGRGLKIAIVKIKPPRVRAIYSYGGSAEKPGKFFMVRNASASGDSIILKWGKPGQKRTLTLGATGNPNVADAKLEAEGARKPLTAKLRKK